MPRKSPKKQQWTKGQWIIFAALGGFGVIGLTLGLIFGDDEGSTAPTANATSSATPAATTTATATRTPSPAESTPAKPAVSAEAKLAEAAPEPEPEPSEPAALSESTAVVHLANAWEDRFIYGGKVHYLLDLRVAELNADGSYFVNMGATVKNQFGTESDAVIEGTVGGTDESPLILSSTLHAATGASIDYFS